LYDNITTYTYTHNDKDIYTGDIQYNNGYMSNIYRAIKYTPSPEKGPTVRE